MESQAARSTSLARESRPSRSQSRSASSRVRSTLSYTEPSFSWYVTSFRRSTFVDSGFLRSSAQKKAASSRRALKTRSFPSRIVLMSVALLLLTPMKTFASAFPLSLFRTAKYFWFFFMEVIRTSSGISR